jgi:hypothetical protein
MFVTLRNLFP